MVPLEPAVEALVLDATGAARVTRSDEVQSLWSGYGKIVRVALEGGDAPAAVVKRVQWPTKMHHPRGWTSSRSHARKVRSYAIESAFYRGYAADCDDRCRVPRLLAESHADDGVLLVLEDLDAAGLGGRRTDVTPDELRACLSWLAHFHATFLGRTPSDLWETGTYWHLETRPDELAAMGDTPLADAGSAVAAVDFQYVGGGPGIKDVAYFIGSCLDERECERQQEPLLDAYFAALEEALHARAADVDVDALAGEWRALYPVAWTDFYRFLAGWSPGHWKVHAYTRRLAREVLATL
jgi:hypothetical protein